MSPKQDIIFQIYGWKVKCAVQLGIVNISTIWLPGFTLANETVDVADGGLGTKFVPFCCQKEEISLSTSFRFFQCLVLQWTPMKKLLISFFNNDDSDNCRRRRRLLIRCHLSVHENESERSEEAPLSLLDYLHRLFGSPRATDGASEIEYSAFIRTRKR